MTDTAPLQTLQSRIEEAVAGYVEMVERADPVVRPLLARWRLAHEDHLAEVAGLIRRHGESPEGGSPLRELVQETVVKARDAVTGIDAGTLDAVLDGEAAIRDAYVAAIDAAAAEEAAILRGQLAVLDALRAETRAAA